MAKGKSYHRSAAGNKVHASTSRGGNAGLTKKTPEAMLAFLVVLGTPGGSVYKACNTIGICRITAYKWKQEDAVFREKWEAAVENRIDQLEGEAERRGFEGVTRPVTIAGEREEVVEYSDTMLALLLKGNRAAKYGTSKLEHSGPNGGPIQHDVRVRFVDAKQEDEE